MTPTIYFQMVQHTYIDKGRGQERENINGKITAIDEYKRNLRDVLELCATHSAFL